MFAEINVYGLYVPALLLLTFAALAVSRLLGHGLARLGLYRLVWHPPLFDACLFVIVLACLSFLFTREF
ncbi:DUF1656 domain-containing protein [Pigmentiphaga sp.]|uniref:DUF1656 domain-containing protein n=1 Tax=Pigmentiphaga sp. TaxID=1977564 RepID=UPI0012C57670|nr:DUF1656 domain-containing protein [Pigmentiphaga sp.]MPS28661.1 DUF1656 domain-containing protein [Alcaligenaceae bacterium SAGV5]MPS52406.1 DUF1656 domain-containing protein [Alcaligenaceae bacterium SAGV3]MPT58123.1 DUF1656 domain-containing protein [Alcaligenaceae bacterium]